MKPKLLNLLLPAGSFYTAVPTLANSGTCYDLTLLDKITDSTGNTQEEPDPVVHHQLELPADLWNTIHALSSYARQFLGQMEKPDVESIEGLPPAISIDQKSTNRNPRSTVGTVTEIYDYFRLLYARVGIPHCPKCGKEIKKQDVDQMVDQIMALPERTKIQLLAPVVRGRKGEHVKVFEQARRSGYVRVRVDGNLYELSEEIKLEKNKKHNIEILVDRLIVKPGIEKRLTDSLESVLHLGDGLAMVDVQEGETLQFSQSFSCPDCGISIDEIEPRSFSFNNPFGACPDCYGLGYKMEFDEDLMIPDKTLSIAEGLLFWGRRSSSVVSCRRLVWLFFWYGYGDFCVKIWFSGSWNRIASCIAAGNLLCCRSSRYASRAGRVEMEF